MRPVVNALFCACLLTFPLSGIRAAEAVHAGDPEAGGEVFIKCSGCHQIGEHAENSIGPAINAIVGRRSGTVPDYEYSPAMKASGLIWDEETLARFLRNATSVVPGTKMKFAGLAKDKDIADLIAYLADFDPNGQEKAGR